MSNALAEEPDEPVTMSELPSELVSNILLRLACDDYHMLTLPLISCAFWRVSRSPEVAAARLASRLRQVCSSVVRAKLAVDGSNEWALAHVSGAMDAAEHFLCPAGRGEQVDRARLTVLREAPFGVASLRMLLTHCCADGASSPSPPPSPPLTAEALFLDLEARRLQQHGGRKQAISLSHIHRETAGDRAAVDAAAAIGLKDNRAAIRREVAAQEQRQVSAECRRRWKLLNAQQRREWGRHAAELARQGQMRQTMAATTAAVATRLLAGVDDHDDET